MKQTQTDKSKQNQAQQTIQKLPNAHPTTNTKTSQRPNTTHKCEYAHTYKTTTTKTNNDKHKHKQTHTKPYIYNSVYKSKTEQPHTHQSNNINIKQNTNYTKP